MKKLLATLTITVLLLSFFGCSNISSENTAVTTISTTIPTTEYQSVTLEPETTVKPAITDYNITGMMNVTNVCFMRKGSSSYQIVGPNALHTATAISVDIICPYCDEESSYLLDFSEIPENLIGQQTFTWTGEKGCSNWADHEDVFLSDYKFSIIFTLRN